MVGMTQRSFGVMLKPARRFFIRRMDAAVQFSTG
jgi:hypothetical protein